MARRSDQVNSMWKEWDAVTFGSVYLQPDHRGEGKLTCQLTCVTKAFPLYHLKLYLPLGSSWLNSKTSDLKIYFNQFIPQSRKPQAERDKHWFPKLFPLSDTLYVFWVIFLSFVLALLVFWGVNMPYRHVLLTSFLMYCE